MYTGHLSAFMRQGSNTKPHFLVVAIQAGHQGEFVKHGKGPPMDMESPTPEVSQRRCSMEGTSASRGPVPKQPCTDLPPAAPTCWEHHIPHENRQKRAQSCMCGSGHLGLAEPCACLCQAQAAGTKEGREQFKIFLSFYLPFQNSPFI